MQKWVKHAGKKQDPRKLQYILGQQKRRRTTFNFFTIKIF